MRTSIQKNLLKDGRSSIYISWSIPLPHPVTKKPVQKFCIDRTLKTDPITAAEKCEAKAAMAFAEQQPIRIAAMLQDGDLSFLGTPDAGSTKSIHHYFLEYIKAHDNAGTRMNMGTTAGYLRRYDPKGTRMIDIDKKWLEGFRAYVLANCKSNNSA
jgi:hypothetical protein